MLWAAEGSPHVLVLGRVSDDPKAHMSALRPLLDYVVSQMADVGIREGRVLMARDAQQMVSYLRQGKVDWITETSGAALGFADEAGARILVRTSRGGRLTYRTVFFTRKDSGIEALEDLSGRALGLQHVMSTSAYLVPASLLLARDLPMVIQASPLERPPPRFVGYVFARSEANLVTWVHKGLVDAAAFSSQDWDELVLSSPELSADLKAIHWSDPYPRAVELVRAQMPANIEARLREVLLNAHQDPAARNALARYFGTHRFVAMDAETAEGLEQLRAGFARVRQEIE